MPQVRHRTARSLVSSAGRPRPGSSTTGPPPAPRQAMAATLDTVVPARQPFPSPPRGTPPSLQSSVRSRTESSWGLSGVAPFGKTPKARRRSRCGCPLFGDRACHPPRKGGSMDSPRRQRIGFASPPHVPLLNGQPHLPPAAKDPSRGTPLQGGLHNDCATTLATSRRARRHEACGQKRHGGPDREVPLVRDSLDYPLPPESPPFGHPYKSFWPGLGDGRASPPAPASRLRSAGVLGASTPGTPRTCEGEGHAMKDMA